MDAKQARENLEKYNDGWFENTLDVVIKTIDNASAAGRTEITINDREVTFTRVFSSTPETLLNPDIIIYGKRLSEIINELKIRGFKHFTYKAKYLEPGLFWDSKRFLCNSHVISW